MRLLGSILATACALITITSAHGDHGDGGERPADWATYHLKEEHHISNFDAASFFTLHDFNSDGQWTPDEIRRTYGLDDESLKDIAPETKHHAVKQVMSLFDPEGTGSISKQSYIDLDKKGVKLPDFNLGPGHHGDDEYEYEIHHFEKFHGADAKEEDLIHPEDIEHFRKHDEMEDEELRVAREQSQNIVEANIPMKFRKQQ